MVARQHTIWSSAYRCARSTEAGLDSAGESLSPAALPCEHDNVAHLHVHECVRELGTAASPSRPRLSFARLVTLPLASNVRRVVSRLWKLLARTPLLFTVAHRRQLSPAPPMSRAASCAAPGRSASSCAPVWNGPQTCSWPNSPLLPGRRGVMSKDTLCPALHECACLEPCKTDLHAALLQGQPLVPAPTRRSPPDAYALAD